MYIGYNMVEAIKSVDSFVNIVGIQCYKIRTESSRKHNKCTSYYNNVHTQYRYTYVHLLTHTYTFVCTNTNTHMAIDITLLDSTTCTYITNQFQLVYAVRLSPLQSCPQPISTSSTDLSPPMSFQCPVQSPGPREGR